MTLVPIAICASVVLRAVQIFPLIFTAVNNGVRDFKGTVLFASHDHEFVQTIATRIIEIREKGVLDKECTYDEFLEFRETYKG